MIGDTVRDRQPSNINYCEGYKHKFHGLFIFFLVLVQSFLCVDREKWTGLYPGPSGPMGAPDCSQFSWNRSHQHSLVGSWTEVSLFDYGNHVDDLRELFKPLEVLVHFHMGHGVISLVLDASLGCAESNLLRFFPLQKGDPFPPL